MKIHELSVAERILLAEELWDSVASNENAFPLTDDQKDVLERRLKQYSIDENAGDSWAVVKNRISS